MKHVLVTLFGVVLLVSWSATANAQTAQLSRVMRDKLSHSQHLLDAIVTSNWAALEQHGTALQQATRDPAWSVLQYPEYASHTARFVRALDDVVDSAKRRDLEAAPLAYVAMTMSCVQCHRYVARMRLADGRPDTGRRQRGD